MNRAKLPFNRAERSWAYNAVKKVDTTISLGSTRALNHKGDGIFLNRAFPTQSEDAVEAQPTPIGSESYCKKVNSHINNLRLRGNTWLLRSQDKYLP
jgi:hypothetical protein